MAQEGDLQLRRLLAKLKWFERGDFARTALKNLEAEAVTQVKLGFRQSRDPYGNAWAPLKHRDGRPLRDTGRLNNSFTAKAENGRLRVGTNVEYAPTHQ